jgi:hypothetical protein
MALYDVPVHFSRVARKEITWHSQPLFYCIEAFRIHRPHLESGFHQVFGPTCTTTAVRIFMHGDCTIWGRPTYVCDENAGTGHKSEE